jgi:lon-related putative ATP-dependent protease
MVEHPHLADLSIAATEAKMPSHKKSQPKPLELETNELPVSALRLVCDPYALGFETTDDLPDLENVIGQPRALSALQLGSEVSGTGYNIFVMGQPGSGRTTLSKEYLERKAIEMPVPDDWCYVNNFQNERRPKIIRLPAGKGAGFRQAIGELISRLTSDIPRTFESDEFIHERELLVADLKKTQESEFLQLSQRVEKFNFVIVRTSSGLALAPGVEGKPIPPEELANLTAEQKVKLGGLENRLGEQVQSTINRMKELEKTAFHQLQELVSRTVQFIIAPLIQPIRQAFSEYPQINAYLDAVQDDLITNLSQFHTSSQGEEQSNQTPADQGKWRQRYEVNLLVDHSAARGAPVIMENYPSYNNLFGRIEHEVIMGASRTDFTMIQSGALHRANGGYLILPARDLMLNPYAWEGLKRVLRDGEIRMVELANQVGLVSSVTLEPEPIPLQVKILLVGSPSLYYSLRAYDDDFTKLFKVRAEFATQMDRTPENEREYGLFIKSVVMENQLLPFDKTAVARIIEYSAKLADYQTRLSTRFGKITDLVREASYWAGKEGSKLVTAAAVDHALRASIYRSNLVEERIQELINEGTLLIDVQGTIAGQINALSVYMLGDYAFGRPTRVTAITYPGKGGIVDIERQAKLGGSLHTKGVLILSGYINSKYGQNLPLSLTASLTFEQSYDEIQGDSASAAELIALLSSIGNLPLRQDRAITGSINQLGQIQAIGGVNEKIEGFFAVCQAQGLTGEQGVIIPSSNQRSLMLTDDVLSAVSEGKFHVWAVNTLEETIPLLTGVEAGIRQPDGSYPVNTLNKNVSDRLNDFNQAVLAATKNTPKPTENEQKENKTEGEGMNANG